MGFLRKNNDSPDYEMTGTPDMMDTLSRECPQEEEEEVSRSSQTLSSRKRTGDSNDSVPPKKHANPLDDEILAKRVGMYNM